MEVRAKGEFVSAYNLKLLAESLLAGLPADKSERAMAGAAILHFLVDQKEMAHMQRSVKQLEARLDKSIKSLNENFKKLRGSEDVEYADGVYEAYTLDFDDSEGDQAKAAAKYFNCAVAQLLVINNMDFCDQRITYDPATAGECVHVADGYSLFKLNIDGVDTLVSEDSIGLFIKRSDYNALMKGYKEPDWKVVTDATNVEGLLNKHKTVRIQRMDRLEPWNGGELARDADPTHSPVIESVQGGRVQGYFVDKDLEEDGSEFTYRFDVKHDGKSFVTQCASVGCPRTRFYFKDWFLQQGD